MVEYCSKMTEHINKITERYIKMAYSKHKMTEGHGDGGLGAAARGINGWSTWGRRVGRCGMKARHARARGSVGHTRVRGGGARTIGPYRRSLCGCLIYL
jgi:hypothetical protein